MNDNLPDAEKLILKLSKSIKAKIVQEIFMIGIHTGGVWIANRINTILGFNKPIGEIDVSFHRDDFAKRGLKDRVRPTDIRFDVENKDIVLFDDVLNSGRTVRAAINEIFDHGRPRKIMLAVLLDRGDRDLPIHADFVGDKILLSEGKKIALKRSEDGSLGFYQAKVSL